MGTINLSRIKGLPYVNDYVEGGGRVESLGVTGGGGGHRMFRVRV